MRKGFSRVNGQSRLANNVQFEGIDNNHRTGLLTVLIPPIEALQTVDITTSNYEAELGRAGGAVTNVTLKSGANDLHGSLYEFNRVSALYARRTDLSTKPRVVYNYFGGTIGGPIVKNKTFFFFDFLAVRDRLGYGQRLTIPSMPFRGGDLSSSPTAVYDPATGNADGTGRQPFSGAIIPQSRINPISQKLLALMPPPTGPGNGINFERNSVRGKNTNSFDIKGDHQFNDKDRISARYSYQKPEVTVPPVFGAAGGPSSPDNNGFSGTGTNKTQNGAVNYTRVFSASFIAELRLGVSRYRNDAQQDDYGKNTADQVGIKGANISQFTSGLTGIDITGYTNPIWGNSTAMPWIRFETNWNLVNNWTKIVGNHTLKFGFDGRLNRDGLLTTNIYSVRGQYRFRAGQTSLNGDSRNGFANAFAAFLLDVPADYGRDLTVVFPEYIQKPFFTYVQDKWQVGKKLTLDIGLRHEFWPPATPRKAGGFSNYDPATNSLVLAGIGANPSNLGRETYYKFFAPRLGVSYRLDEKTVLRSGFGISYLPYPDNQYAYNFPVSQAASYLAPNAYVAAGAMTAGFPAPTPAAVPSDGIIRNAPEQQYNVIPKNFHEAYVASWNVAAQRALPGNFVLEAAWVANSGVRIPIVYNLNAGLLAGAGQFGQPLYNQFGRRGVTNVRFVGAHASYQSMQVKLDRRFSKGFLMTTAYTWSKAIDYSNDNGGLSFYINQRRNRSRSDFDHQHVFVQSYVYELPFGKGKKYLTAGVPALVAGGWQINGILTAQSGPPINFTFNSASLNAPGNNNSPSQNGPVAVSKAVSLRGGPGWFDTSVFSTPAPGAFGNAGRNSLTGPGYFNLDFSVFRKFQVRERATAEFRFESFNFTNTPQYDLPNGELGNASFGRITGVLTAVGAASRQIELGLRLVF